jgi:lipopolysaccharide/colanic/teichoic acid biosynthesis glycosyltransferase
VNFDLEYISRRSAGEDLRIMLLTLPAVLKKRGW